MRSQVWVKAEKSGLLVSGCLKKELSSSRRALIWDVSFVLDERRR